MSSQRGAHLKRVVGFALVPAATMASTLLVLPLLSRQFGPLGWSAVGIGQSIGAFVSIVAGMGWQVVGAQLVAESSPLRRRTLFVESLKSRAAMLMVLLVPAIAVCCLLTPAYQFEAAVFVIAMGLNCLNASWYFSGTGQSRFVLINEGLVRLSGYLISIPLLAWTQSLMVYAVVLLATGLISAFCNFAAILLPWSTVAWKQSNRTIDVVKEQLTGAVSRMLTATQLHVGPAIVAVVQPQSLHVFVALYNVHKAVNNATAAYPQAFAWWVGSSNSLVERIRRTRLLSFVTLSVVIAISLGWAVLGIPLVAWLYNGNVELSTELNLVCGVSMAMFAASRAAGLLGLIPLGMQKTVYISASVAAIFCIGGMVLGTYWLGTYGAFIAMAVSGFALTIYLFAARSMAARRLLGEGQE
ncbi:lipopolysaccharide biosynthesis protein [Pseudarthrobacter sp. 1C304]|uniref:lipopolysaccharide biosynthesis protein n=1 Tax=Pseudarthrobacter sp. 1C304 TaxID=3457438 RepID=UPI003FCFBCC8